MSSPGEDRSRVRGHAALNLAVIRRAVVSLAVRWIGHCKDKRRATLSGFYDFMSAQNGKHALKTVTLSKPSWLTRLPLLRRFLTIFASLPGGVVWICWGS